MRAIALQRPGELMLIERPVPTPGPGQVLVRVAVAGVCQTDVHIIRGTFQVPLPRVLGHEFAGEVLALGRGVTGLSLGQMIGVDPPSFCGECAYCRRGQPQQCQSFRCLGNTEDGGWAELVLIKAEQAIPLTGLSVEQAVWLEPLACIMHAFGSDPKLAGASVLIIGAGPLGLLALQTVRARGASLAAIVDPNPGKISRAAQLGAGCALVIPREGETTSTDQSLLQVAPLGFDVVLDTTGKPISLTRGLQWVGRTGSVIFFGVSDRADRVEISPAHIFAKEITLRGASGSTHESFAEALKVMQSGQLDPDVLVWRRISLDEVPKAVEALEQPGEKGKVLIYPSGPGR